MSGSFITGSPGFLCRAKGTVCRTMPKIAIVWGTPKTELLRIFHALRLKEHQKLGLPVAILLYDKICGPVLWRFLIPRFVFSRRGCWRRGRTDDAEGGPGHGSKSMKNR